MQDATPWDLGTERATCLRLRDRGQRTEGLELEGKFLESTWDFTQISRTRVISHKTGRLCIYSRLIALC